MPPLVGVAVAALASSTAVGGALGLGASIAATISGTVAAALDTSVVIGDAVAGAAVGAAAGAGTAAAGGTSVSKGLLYGAATGGLTAGLTPEVQSLTGLSQGAAEAITSGVVTTGSTLAQGVPLGKALQYGAVGGAGSYAGDQLFNKMGSGEHGGGQAAGGATPDYSGASVGDVTGIERSSIPVGSIPPYVAPDTSQPPAPASSPPPSPQSSSAPETVTVTGQQDQGVPTIGSVFVGPTGTETANVSANAATSNVATSSPTLVGNTAPETVTVTGTKPSVNSQSPADPGVKTAEKGALEAALFALLFPSGSSQFNPTKGAATSPAGVIAPSGSSGSPSGGGGGSLSPSAQAALSSVGQSGSSSLYAPGGPLLGAPGGGRYNAWNKSSLRTDQG